MPAHAPARIDLDQNATTALDPEVLEAMRPHWLAGGNPESRHAAGRAARRALDTARDKLARILGAEPREVVFTSGGTEAANLAVFSLARTAAGAGHIVCSPVEHPAVAEPIAWLESHGFEVSRPPCRTDGLVDPVDFTRAIVPGRTRMVTLLLAQNEVGAIEPVAEVARLAAAQGVPVHTDAAQAVGRIRVDFHALGVATLSLSAHKLHGPVGIGALLVRQGIQLEPMLFGGGQQRGQRPGTVPVALAVGLAAALEKWDRESSARQVRWIALRDRLETGLAQALGPERAVVHGPRDPALRLPQTLHVGFPGVDPDALLMQLDLEAINASQGSACASGSTRPSPTLEAMGVPADQLRSSVRFSFGATTTEAEIEAAVDRVVRVVRRLQSG